MYVILLFVSTSTLYYIEILYVLPLQQALIDVKRSQVQKYHKAKDGLERAEIELDPFVVFHKALENGKPKMHLRKVIRAGSVLQVTIDCINPFFIS